jgi:hypothetical protein
MPLTKAALDAELVDRCGGLLAFVGLPTVANGTNPATIGPIREGLASLGLTLADFAAVADADLAAVTTTSIPQLVDVAEYRLLQNILGWLTKVDQTIGMGSQSLGQVRRDLLQSLKSMQESLRVQYGYGLGTPSGGSVDLGFAQTDPCQTERLYPWWN